MMKRVRLLLSQFLNRFFGGNPGRDHDPYAGSPVRNKRGPQDRSAAVAVAEPDDE